MDGYEERRNKVRRFQLTSDILFCKVLEDKEACQEVIRILLGHPSLVVKDVKTQYSIDRSFWMCWPRIRTAEW